MENVIVGEEGFESQDIITILRSSKVSNQITNKLDSIAMGLGVGSELTNNMRRANIRESKTEWEMLLAYIEDWQGRQTKESPAYLKILIEILKDNKLNLAVRVLTDACANRTTLDSSSATNVESAQHNVLTNFAPLAAAPRFNKVKAARPEYPELWDLKLYKDYKIPVKVVAPKHPMIYKGKNAIVLPADSSKGNMCIINILQYHNAAYNRKGAIVDTYNMGKLWTQLGYEVEKHHDKDKDFTTTRVSAILEEFTNTCIDENVKSVVVFIGAHGLNEEIIVADGKSSMNIKKDIVRKMAQCAENRGESKYWAEIPKIFIIQACRSDPTDAVEKLDQNTIICYATMPGDTAYRMGAYVHYLTKEMMTNAHKTDFKKMLENTENTLWDELEGNRKQNQQSMYEIIGGFKTLYFEIQPEGENTFWIKMTMMIFAGLLVVYLYSAFFNSQSPPT